MKWLRLYDDVLNDPKVQRLDPVLFKHWINLLCIANRASTRGIITDLDDVAYQLRLDNKQEADSLMSRMVDLGLLDITGIREWSPHGWFDRQYQSDTSTPRVQKHRETLPKRSKNVAVTPPDTDTDTETEQNQIESTHLNGATPPKKKPVKKLAVQIPDDWEPQEKAFEVGREIGLSEYQISTEAIKFRNHAIATGRTLVNWDAGFRVWIERAVDFMPRHKTGAMQR